MKKSNKYLLTVVFKKNNFHLNVVCRDNYAIKHLCIYKKSSGCFQQKNKTRLLNQQLAVQDLKSFLKTFDHLKIYLVVKGIFKSQSNLVTLLLKELNIIDIYYESVKPHNGCRKKKERRL